jgi:tetratricopeptide (TPR) repeat protein
MAGGDFSVFVSAVTSEFGDARSAVASDLRSRGLSVKVQEDFRLGAGADTLLRKLRNYIHDCSAVVCVIGDRSGAGPTRAEAEPFAHLLPPQITQASYTQWEFFLARHFRRNLYLYLAENYSPDGPAPGADDSNLQQAYVQYIEALGLDRQSFATDDELRRKILREEWTNPRRPKPIVLPYPSIGLLFKGREEFLSRMRESLVRGGQTAIVSQALYGLGGIGKTRAAVEYAWAHRDGYSALLFVVAETPEALRRNLAALASILVPKLDTTEDAVRLQAVLDWLVANPGWFLILDNVDTKPAMAEVEGLLGGLSGGHVVVTSRLADFSGNFQPLELDVLTVDNAASFLLARTESRRRTATDDDAKAREVATELGQLALALEQAAALIAKRRLTFSQYLEQWRLRRDEILEWFDDTMTGYPRAVAVTWQTSVAQLSENGQRLLERLAWLAPEKVPELLIDVPIPGAESDNLRDALDDLAAYSLVTRDAEGPFFLVHRLVQDVTRRSLLTEGIYTRVKESLGWIDQAFDGDPADVQNWTLFYPLAPHAHTIIEHAAAVSIVQPTSKLMNQLGIFLQARALPHEAEPLFQKALALDEARLGPDHPNVAVDLITLAWLLRAIDKPKEAESLIRRALTIDEKHFGPNHAEVATDLFALAGCLMDFDRADEAEPMIRRALSIRESNLGPHHPGVAIGLNNLAQVLIATGQQAEVETLMQRAIAIDENVYGHDHPNVGRHLSNLGEFFQDASRFAEAESLKRRALEIDENSYGLKHLNVALRLNSLAILLAKTERLTEAEPLMRRAAIIFMEFALRTGRSHQHMNTILNNYASMLKTMGQSVGEIEAAIKALWAKSHDNESA